MNKIYWCEGGLQLAIMLIYEYLNKDPDIVPDEAPLIVLDSKSAMCMAKNGKDTKHTRHILSTNVCQLQTSLTPIYFVHPALLSIPYKMNSP